jgi:hypothetical protein
MKDFKFFQKVKVARCQPGYVKFKDVHNRDKYLILNWSEYPSDMNDVDIKTFQGNILDFYNFVRSLQSNIKVYEIHKQYRGYHEHSLVYGNRNRHNEFIARKFYLTIKYNHYYEDNIFGH